MADFPYTTVTGKIGPLLDKIKEVGVPDKVTRNWLESVGFKSKNDRSLITVIKYVDLVDTSGKPTPRWNQFRGKDGGAVLAEGIKKGYSQLYSMYPTAHTQSDDNLSSFFSTKTSAGATAVSKTVTTFKNLCQKADFTKAAPYSHNPEGKTSDGHITSHSQHVGQTPVTINITINMPETDAKTYESFFKAMKDNLLT